MSVDVYGVFGWAFTDFGKNFEIFDKNGEETKEVFLSDISREAEATVTTLEHHMHGLEVGDAIKLTEVEGMIDLNYTERNPVVFKVTKGTFIARTTNDTIANGINCSCLAVQVHH